RRLRRYGGAPKVKVRSNSPEPRLPQTCRSGGSRELLLLILWERLQPRAFGPWSRQKLAAEAAPKAPSEPPPHSCAAYLSFTCTVLYRPAPQGVERRSKCPFASTCLLRLRSSLHAAI